MVNADPSKESILTAFRSLSDASNKKRGGGTPLDDALGSLMSADSLSHGVRLPLRFVIYIKRKRDDLSKRIQKAYKERERPDWGPVIDVQPDEKDKLLKWADEMRGDESVSIADRSAAVKLSVNIREAFRERAAAPSKILASTPPAVKPSAELDRLIGGGTVKHPRDGHMMEVAQRGGPFSFERISWIEAARHRLPADDYAVLVQCAIHSWEQMLVTFSPKKEMASLITEVIAYLKSESVK